MERRSLGEMAFVRVNEPRENAFSLALPEGWQLEGGIVRENLAREAVSAQSIAAKVDLAVKRDTEGSVMLRWCPEILYCDLRYSPGGGIGLFPQGSNYMGMLVWPAMSAEDFATQMLFPWAHPQASDVRVEAREAQPQWIDDYRQGVAARGLLTNLQYDAACVTLSYREANTRYREKVYVLLEAMFPLGVGTWSNKSSLCLRAPETEFAAWEPVLSYVRDSGQPNHAWQASEIVTQEILSQSFLDAQQAAQWRAQRQLQVQRELQRAAEQILEHKRRVHAEIRNDQYLTLTSQEEYLNPITRRIDMGSNQWRYRWVTDSGQEFYTNEEFLNPNDRRVLGRYDWQRTPVRPRYPDGPASVR
ncbi:MAG: hypothetical protein GX557_08905 [Chloroflexi bacterium]|nr:hypothetical protein [Chloroflexota bacterium]